VGSYHKWFCYLLNFLTDLTDLLFSGRSNLNKLFLTRANLSGMSIYQKKKKNSYKMKAPYHCFWHLISYVITGSNDSYFKLTKKFIKLFVSLNFWGSRLLFEKLQIQKHCSKITWNVCILYLELFHWKSL